MNAPALVASTWCRRLLSGLCGAVLVALVAWGIGFAWFLHMVSEPAGTPAHVEGIVAFTGGPDRVETALRLLSEGRADKLLLSGIGGGAELTELAHRAGVDPLSLASRVTIGRTATTTLGNALETAAWARANAIHSLLVVTASYHMPRAMTELARALPEVTLYPRPVASPDKTGHAMFPLRLTTEEYIKYLAARTGLTSMLPAREPAPAHGSHAG
jgi:uncharacterized SAM-binding protein YcdF (DUF218 family)